MRPLAIPIVFSAMLAAGACNERVSVLDTPVSPSPATATAVLPPQPDVATVNLLHGAVTAGGSIRGVVNLLGPAGADGATVSLSSSDNAASVPPTVRISAGDRSGEFTVTTRLVPEGRQVQIVASTPGRSTVAALAIWAELPMFFTWFSEPGDFIGQGGFNRLTPGDAEFSGVCDRNEVRIQMNAPDPVNWLAWFRAAEGEPLRTGAYESVTRITNNSPHATMSIGGRGRACNALIGRFVIHEIDLRNDRVNRFRVSFEQQCVNNGPAAWLRGELSVANLPPSSSVVSCLR